MKLPDKLQPFSKQEHSGEIKNTFYWLIFLTIGVSKTVINDGNPIWSLHITPFIQISFGYMGSLNGINKTEL